MALFKAKICMALVVILYINIQRGYCATRKHKRIKTHKINAKFASFSPDPIEANSNYINNNNALYTVYDARPTQYRTSGYDKQNIWINSPSSQQQLNPQWKSTQYETLPPFAHQKQAHMPQLYVNDQQSLGSVSHSVDSTYSLAPHHIYDNYAILPKYVLESTWSGFNGNQMTANVPNTGFHDVNEGKKTEESVLLKIRGPPIKQYPTIPKKLKSQLTKDHFVNEGGDGEIFKVNIHGKVKALKRVKRIKKDFTLERTKFEIDLMSTLQSKYVIKINRKYKDRNFIYYTMDLATFSDGFDMINNVRAYYNGEYADMELVVRFAIFDVVRGLMAIHALGVLHHDMKWTNTLVFQTRFAISDFGMSRLMNAKEVPGNIFGTLNTLAPEALNAEQPIYDSRADIWSLGVMLYEALFGFNPFNKTGNLPLDTVIDNILNLKDVEVPEYVSENARQFLTKTICSYQNRFANIHEVFQHPWFDEIRHLYIKRRFSPWVDIFTKKPIEENRKKLETLRKLFSPTKAE